MAAQRLLRRATRATPRCAPCWPRTGGRWPCAACSESCSALSLWFGRSRPCCRWRCCSQPICWPMACSASLQPCAQRKPMSAGAAPRPAAQANERWGLLLAEGVLNIVMGVIAALFPGAALFAFVIVTAAWALVSGGLMLAAAFKLTREHGRWLLALGGVVSIIYGLLLISAPLLGLVVLTWWLGAYALAFGVIMLVLAFRLRGQKNQRTGAGPALPRNA